MENSKKHSDKHKSHRHASSSLEESELPLHSKETSPPRKEEGESREWESQEKANMKRQLSPDQIISREVDISDLPSHYTEDFETFRQLSNIPGPKNSIPVFSASVMDLNKGAQKQDLRFKSATFLSANPSLKEALEKFELDFKTANPP